MDAQERIDKILTFAVSRMQEEVAALLGVDFLIAEKTCQAIRKEGFFDQADGKQIVARMEVSGELSGLGCLMVNIRDAIRLGGTLIMLPTSELDEFVGREDYSDDIADSFGEIANILCGSLSKVFEENYPKACRLVRQDYAVVKPAKVDMASEQPFPDQPCYQLRAAMSLAGVAMGDLFVLLPAEPFGLAELAPPPATKGPDAVAPSEMLEKQPDAEKINAEKIAESAATTGEPATATTTGVAIDTAPDAEEINVEKIAESAATTGEPAAATTTGVVIDTAPDAAVWREWKERFDTLLTEAGQTLQGEFSSLLGAEAQLGAPETSLVTKAEFFQKECDAPQLMADLEVIGDINGAAYLFCALKDAIHLGGTLIMLPPSELEIVVAEEDLTPDAEDAYGEIANIIAGVYSGVFEERARKKFRLVKRGLQKVAPLKVEIAAATPIADILYYQSAMDVRVDGKTLGKLRLLFPADLLELRPPLVAQQPDAAAVAATSQERAEAATANATPALAAAANAGSIEALVISDDEIQGERVAAVISQSGMAAKRISFKDNLYSWLPGRVRVIFLVMREVDDQAFGIAIKIGAVCPLPLIAVAPGWTRSRVIKAVRYGVSDILVSPASAALIEEGLRQNLAAH